MKKRLWGITLSLSLAVCLSLSAGAASAGEVYYTQPLLWAQESGITAELTVDPLAPCTRAQAITLLHRAAGSPAPAGTEQSFTDIPADAPYADAAVWAAQQGITAGTAEGTFDPDALCTRAQMITFLYRYEQAAGGGFTGMWMFRLPFTDLPDWAYEPVAWCYKEKITAGTGPSTFSPEEPCTLAQAVTFLHRYFGK